MTTHQEINGASDQEMVERMVERYPGRFNDEYWSVFLANVGRHLDRSRRSSLPSRGRCRPGTDS